MKYIPRLRRINDVVKEIQNADPDTELNWLFIQHLIKAGKLTAIKYGNSWLINLDELYGLFWRKK